MSSASIMRRWHPTKQSLDRAWLAVCLPCRSLEGSKWLWACICLSWLLRAVTSVLHHAPYTGWLMVLPNLGHLNVDVHNRASYALELYYHPHCGAVTVPNWDVQKWHMKSVCTHLTTAQVPHAIDPAVGLLEGKPVQFSICQEDTCTRGTEHKNQGCESSIDGSLYDLRFGS
eukprot:1152949-Pelagomonas_calceolata.AAC.1